MSAPANAAGGGVASAGRLRTCLTCGGNGVVHRGPTRYQYGYRVADGIEDVTTCSEEYLRRAIADGEPIIPLRRPRSYWEPLPKSEQVAR